MNSDKGMQQIVVLRSDMPGEDEAYNIGAVYIPEDMTPDQFEEVARDVLQLLSDHVPDYEDDILLKVLEAMGYELADTPYVITVRG